MKHLQQGKGTVKHEVGLLLKRQLQDMGYDRKDKLGDSVSH